MNASNAHGGSAAALATAASIVFLIVGGSRSHAQNVIDLGIQLQAAGGIAVEDPFGAAANKSALLEPAELKTDSGSQEILTQADVFVSQGRYDLASILWQRVIDESGDQVFTRDEWKERTLQNEYQKFRSVTGDIESTLAKLPPEGLAAYRLKADGEARALMNAAGSKDRESALAEIVRRFFLSKLGDDAAFELACLKLDRGEFLPAARLLAKIADEYPDPSVRLGEIELRLAAVNARVGDLELAREMLGKIKSQPIPPVPVAVIRLVESDIEDVANQRTVAADRVGSWTMLQGGPTRSGLMPGPAGDAGRGLLTAWIQKYRLTMPDGEEWEAIAKAQEANADADEQPGPQAVQDPFGRPVRGRAAPTPATHDEVIQKWRERDWLPVGQVLMNDGKLYFKTHDRIVCCDAATGELNWFGYRSAYPADPLASINARYRAYYGSRAGSADDPSGEREVLSFSDMLNQSMSIVGDKLLVVQGRALDFYEDGDLDEAGLEEEAVNVRRFGRFPGGEELGQGRARDNRLFAYHAKNGKLLWMLKPAEMMPESKRKMAIAGSPVPYGSLVVVPVYEGSSLWLFGLDPDQGRVLWKSFLADEPAGQTAANSPVRVAIDGGEAYVATGAEIIASLDAISGTLNWAVAYPRTSRNPADAASNARNLRFNGIPQIANLDGWEDDTIIPSGNAIVFAASDFNQLAALDRRTGNLLWESAKRPIEGEPESKYVLGVAEEKVFVAGNDIVRAYRLGGGRLLWEERLEGAGHGRGMLTSAGIYMPLEKSIVKLSLDDGKVTETIPVHLAADDQPVGNLFSDGERIFSAGYRQINALRVPAEGEQPAAADAAPQPEPEADGPAKARELLAAEGRELVTAAYDKLAAVKDAAGAREAGEFLVQTSEKLTALAARMAEAGEPPVAERAVYETAFAIAQATNAENFNSALARIITVEDAAGNVLEKIVGMHKTIEELPILKTYGIDLEADKKE